MRSTMLCVSFLNKHIIGRVGEGGGVGRDEDFAVNMDGWLPVLTRPFSRKKCALVGISACGPQKCNIVRSYMALELCCSVMHLI